MGHSLDDEAAPCAKMDRACVIVRKQHCAEPVMTSLRQLSPLTLRLKVEQSRILIVDDDPDALSLLYGILSQDGYHVTTALHARAAMEQLPHCMPDLIVTDLNMPHMDGLAFLAELRARQLDMPVILMTAFGSLKTAVEGIKAGSVVAADTERIGGSASGSDAARSVEYRAGCLSGIGCPRRRVDQSQTGAGARGDMTVASAANPWPCRGCEPRFLIRSSGLSRR